MDVEPDCKRIHAIYSELGLSGFAETLPKGLNTSMTKQFTADGVELS